jgi:hypothetical protein
MDHAACVLRFAVILRTDSPSCPASEIQGAGREDLFRADSARHEALLVQELRNRFNDHTHGLQPIGQRIIQAALASIYIIHSVA